MGRMNKANLKKTVYYLKRNGLKKTWYAVRERLEEKKQPPYVWTPPSETELEAQRTQWKEKGFNVTFSILVPTYRTKPEYLKELLDSLYCQTYPKWELILADATEDDSVERILQSFLPEGYGTRVSTTVPGDVRIRYVHLERNGGIAENTNQALPYATGDYVGLLDHDDILTENALYEMEAAIEEGRQRGIRPQILYSDEDKCNGDRTEYYEPNYKEDFNLDLLLSNNYICHFLVMDRQLIQNLKFRKEYEGAQDYDLVLRAAAALGTAGHGMEEPEAVRQGTAEPGAATGQEAAPACLNKEKTIVHIPKVLYHWRCHTGSTAENPQSKLYAYEAGRRAIQDFADKAGWRAKAVDTAHVGFYRLEYEGSLFDSRPDIGAVGGSVISKGRIVGGRMTEIGSLLYENLPIHYSGYLHRAILSQDAYAVDLRNIRVRPECRNLFWKIIGVSYQTLSGTDIFDASVLPGDCDIYRASLAFCKALRDAGYRVLYLPETKV